MDGTSVTDFQKYILSLNLSNNLFILKDTTDDVCSSCLEGLDRFTHLSSLTINNSGLKSIPLSIGKLSHLRKLTVNKNELRSFRERIRECQKLRWIMARHNRLTSEGVCATNLCKLEKLSVLDLSHNNLLFIPKDFGSIVNLTVLNLAHNNIRMIPKILFTSLKNLLFLDLSDNCLETIPETLQVLKKLKTLSLNNNSTLSCEHLGALVYLRSLKSLGLSNTDRCLGGLPDLRHLVNLAILDISKNSLSSLPSHVYGLCRLRVLNLASNCISVLSTNELNKQSWQSLQTLNLSRNRITSLPSSLMNSLASCRYLFINANQLTFEGLPIGFDKLSNLELLSLTGNKLKTFPESLGRCSKLKRLDIGQNPVVTYPQAFSQLKSQGCIITSIDDNIFNVKSDQPTVESIPNYQVNVEMNGADVFLDNVGTNEGVQCWFIDNFSPKVLEIPSTLYSGECYIFLKSIKYGSPFAFRHEIHIWIGKDAPVDKLGSVAVYAVQLRRVICRTTHVSSQCITLRHDQGNESNEFYRIFKNKIRIEWGCLTGSAMYTISESDNCICGTDCNGPICRRMYLINFENGVKQKGKLWALRIPSSKEYFNKHSSVLIRLKIKEQKKDLVILWSGKDVSNAKRAKVRLFTEQYSKEDISVDGHTEILDFQENEEPAKFWLLVFKDTKPDIIRYNRFVCRSNLMGLNDIVFYIVRIKQCEISLEQDQRRQKHRNVLKHSNVYIVDCWTDLYVWVGNHSHRLERAAAVKISEELTTLIQRPTTSISIQLDGSETFLFRQIMENEQKKKINKGVAPSAPPCAPPLLPTQCKCTVKTKLDTIITKESFISNGTNKLNDQSIEINGLELSSSQSPRILGKEDNGKFYSDACYVYIIDISEKNKSHKTLVYFWQGREVKTNKSWFIFNAHLKRQLTQLFGVFELFKIYQQQEPIEFISLFNHKMIIYFPQRQEIDTQFFQISVHSKQSLKTVEVEEINELCPLCIYIVFVKLSTHAGVVYVWQSSQVNDADVFLAEKIASGMFADPNFPVQRIIQGQEPMDFFWRSLGGIKNVCVFTDTPRLFHCSNSKGYFEIIENMYTDLCQDCLLDGDVSILDDGCESLFVWIGECASQNLIVKSIRTAQIYAGRRYENNEGKCLAKKMRFISKCNEPQKFKRCFFNWSKYKSPPVDLEKRFL